IVLMGEDYATAWGIFNTIRWGLVMVPVQALEASTLTFVGHNWGKWRARVGVEIRRPKASKADILGIIRPALVSSIIALVFEVIMCICLSTRGMQPFAYYLSQSPRVAEITETMFRSIDWCYIFYGLDQQLAAILLATSPRWYLYQALASNFLWILPWAIVVTKIQIPKTTAWTYYAVIFGGALVFNFLDLVLTVSLWAWRLAKGKMKIEQSHFEGYLPSSMSRGLAFRDIHKMERSYEDIDLNRLNLIHVAGTKGKGSTCAFAASFLGVHGERTGFPKKIGLYTSPHLNTVRERIQINSRPISKALFAKYFFEVLDRLSGHVASNEIDWEKIPRYLQFLALLSFHVFISEGVEAAIYETHSGGECDATNIISQPIVTGITTLGMDHVELFGPLLENIAWHKAGIFKSGSPAFSTSQEPEATAMLESRAAEKKVTLKFINIDPTLPANAPALKPEVQRVNCSLALALVNAFLEERAPKEHPRLTPQDILRGVEHFAWPGRFQSIIEGNHQWFLDGAHNELSVQKAAQWFGEITSESQSHISQRDGGALLKCIAQALQEDGVGVQHVIFSTYKKTQDGTTKTETSFESPELLASQSLQESYVEVWKGIDPGVRVSIEPTIEGALELARRIGNRGKGMQALVTGSLHLVGGALWLLEPIIPSTPNGETTDTTAD
ncbi:MAG: hypothetical protein Q9187_004435, partial [Circinaria calcarea]